jgi:hypothetical protein
MTLIQAVKARLGKAFLQIPEDGVMRSFACGDDTHCFVIAFPDCACFGSWVRGLCWSWAAGQVHEQEIHALRFMPQATKERELMIIKTGQEILYQGNGMPSADLARYMAALQRVRYAL